MFERRELERFQVGEALVRYNKCHIFPLDKKPVGRDYPLVNVSLQGIRFITDEALPVHDQLSISIDIPAFSHPINLKARICWTRPQKGPDRFLTGARFLHIPKSDELKLELLLDDRILRKKSRAPSKPGAQGTLG